MKYKKRRRPSTKTYVVAKVCRFCNDKMDWIDYKDVKIVRTTISERGKIIPRRISGNCAKHQRMVTTAVNRARNIALVPFTA